MAILCKMWITVEYSHLQISQTHNLFTVQHREHIKWESEKLWSQWSHQHIQYHCVASINTWELRRPVSGFMGEGCCPILIWQMVLVAQKSWLFVVFFYFTIENIHIFGLQVGQFSTCNSCSVPPPSWNMQIFTVEVWCCSKTRQNGWCLSWCGTNASLYHRESRGLL